MFNSTDFNKRLLREKAGKIPALIRKKILKDKMIDRATTNYEVGSPMEFLFDVYIEFINGTEFNDFECPTCRTHIYNEFIEMKPYLVELNKK